ncbi:MAG TPA: fructose PTS transporter subunit IIA [Actinomycetota bacterium]|nr:fructose PTS transporter subunit IIA [Actinomycetota bacterium]
MTTIEELITPSLVSIDLRATERRGAIEELAALLRAEGRVADLPAYVEAVWAREEETGGTGMGSGVAIPHAKSAAVTRASVAFGRSASGVDFGAEDGSRADLIFLIAAPEGADDLHVTVLSRLARRLVHEGFRAALREAGSPQDVYDVIRKEVEL